ncbi:MAG: hypothetical protein EOM41_08155 [Bacilli bacterium]|nr:hypothetical protein [Bacilli bacterium]
MSEMVNKPIQKAAGGTRVVTVPTLNRKVYDIVQTEYNQIVASIDKAYKNQTYVKPEKTNTRFGNHTPTKKAAVEHVFMSSQEIENLVAASEVQLVAFFNAIGMSVDIDTLRYLLASLDVTPEINANKSGVTLDRQLARLYKLINSPELAVR